MPIVYPVDRLVLGVPDDAGAVLVTVDADIDIYADEDCTTLAGVTTFAGDPIAGSRLSIAGVAVPRFRDPLDRPVLYARPAGAAGTGTPIFPEPGQLYGDVLDAIVAAGELLDAETAARVAGDDALTAAIVAESAARVATDANHGGRIADLEADLAAETAARATADGNETAARVAGDNALNSLVGDLAVDLANEADFRVAGDNAEAAARVAAVAVVQADVDGHEANVANPHAVTAVQVGAMPAVAQSENYMLWTPGWYYNPPGGLGTTQPAESEGRYELFVVPRAVTVDRIGIHVTTAGTAGAVVRLGIYLDNGNLLLDAGTVDATTTGWKEIAIDQALPAGLVFPIAVVQGGAISRPQLRSLSGYSMGIGFADAASVIGAGGSGYAVSPIAGALPAVGLAVTTGVSAVRIALRRKP